ncbi:MAG: chitobiase/beta-hexosaminidase C-terminal domain-containing protein [Candidatus Cloacimonetes bacterium]|nr:chitobiase/beta-hexosaminidase C-terminal domain-containing protein [Candidatus Cloacimonadota bacterium]
MKKLLFMFMLSLMMGSGLFALAAGDIAIIAVHTDASKYMAFVTLTDIPANTVISFTDNAWNATTETWRSGEGTIAWSNEAQTDAGTVVHIGLVSPFSANVGTVTTSSGFTLSTSGDQVLAYEGTTAPTTNNDSTWLYGFSTESFSWGDSSTTSDIPTVLADYSVAITLTTTDVDNAVFANGSIYIDIISVTGSKSELLMLFTDNTKYFISDTAIVIPEYTFTVTGGGLPFAATPTFNPEAGTYYTTQSVTISTTTPGASIYYTLNGDNPTDASTQYTSAIQITTSTTVKAIAYASGYQPSSIAMADYVIETPQYATIPYTQTFDADMGDTYSYSVSGPTKTWYYTDGTAAINGYNSGDTEEDWLILPGLNMNLNSYEKMSFETWGLYGTPGVDNYLKLFYSTNYAGVGNPSSATWTEISFTSPSEPDVWANSGLLDLSGISGTSVFFAFKYYAVAGNYTYWKVDNINIYNLDPGQAVVTVSTSSLSGFNYEVDQGPSESQTFTVSGVNLSGSISIVASANYRVSSNGTFYSTSLSLTPVSSTVDVKTIYVRLTSGLSIGDYPGTITISSTGVDQQTITLSGAVTEPIPPAANLFFSEYLEGSSNNKALEIYNASGAPVVLSNYRVDLYANGATTPGNTLTLSGTLADASMFIIANASSIPTILDVADVTATVTYFNGDDAVALVYIPDESIIDVIGEIGNDPGTAWNVAGVTNATLNHTLIRKPTVATGNSNWAAQQGTNAEDSEWIVMAQDYIADLGLHTYNPGGNPMASAPVFDPPAGAYLVPINVSLSSSTPDAVIRYTTDGSEPTATYGTIYSTPIAISASTTIKAIAYADGYDPSIVVEATYAYPTPISNIAALRTQPTGNTYVYTLTGEAVLTFQLSNRNQKYIQDATAAILIDDYSAVITSTYNLYDGITGITGYLSLYNQLLQFIPVADPGPATSANNVVEPEVRTLASLTSADQCKLIKVMDISFLSTGTFSSSAQNINVEDASGSLVLRTFTGADYAGTTIPVDPVNLICLVGQYGDDMQIGHRFLSDIEMPLSSPEVDIALMDTMLHLSWPAVSGATSYRVEAADNPYATAFTTVGTTSYTEMLITPSASKKFYRVIALP